MTVDEYASKLIRDIETLYGKPLPDRDAARVALTIDLQDLVLTESVRAAGVVNDARTPFLRLRSAALRKCHDEILATSPGKGGA